MTSHPLLYSGTIGFHFWFNTYPEPKVPWCENALVMWKGLLYSTESVFKNELGFESHRVNIACLGLCYVRRLGGSIVLTVPGDLMKYDSKERRKRRRRGGRHALITFCLYSLWVWNLRARSASFLILHKCPSFCVPFKFCLQCCDEPSFMHSRLASSSLYTLAQGQTVALERYEMDRETWRWRRVCESCCRVTEMCCCGIWRLAVRGKKVVFVHKREARFSRIKPQPTHKSVSHPPSPLWPLLLSELKSSQGLWAYSLSILTTFYFIPLKCLLMQLSLCICVRVCVCIEE